MSHEAGEEIPVPPTPVAKTKAKAKITPKPKASSCVSQPVSWDFRIARANQLGQIASAKLRNDSAVHQAVQSTGLKNRYWVVVRGSYCAHVGFTARFSIADSHISVASSSESDSAAPSPICEAFASLAEVREFWNQVYPESSLEHLQSVCNPLQHLSTQ